MAPLPFAHLVSPVVRGRGGVGEPARTTRHSPNRSTGQDAVAVIKNELKLLIPGIKIFLDVDDLKDIGSLEDYVDRTQVMLFFLSKGYFRSKALPQPLPFRECLAVSPTTSTDLADVLGFNFTNVLAPAEGLPPSTAQITQFVHGIRILLFVRVGVYCRFVNGTASATRAPCGQSP